MAGPLAPLVLAEIAERHAFFERWFNGLGEENALARSLERFDPAFRRIDPVGARSDFAGLGAALAARRGARAAEPVAITVEDLAVAWESETAVLATYVEVQGPAGSADGRHRRRSTALFVLPPGGGPPLWRHVQETLIHADGA